MSQSTDQDEVEVVMEDDHDDDDDDQDSSASEDPTEEINNDDQVGQAFVIANNTLRLSHARSLDSFSLDCFVAVKITSRRQTCPLPV